MKTLIETRHLSKKFRDKRDALYAVSDINLSIIQGEILGLVGESGCGKSTLGRLLLRLYEPTKGSVWFDGKNLHDLNHQELKHQRKRMQIIFQDPFASLNPRLTIQEIIAEPLDIHHIVYGPQRQQRVIELLERVGLNSNYLYRFPHELSGGQCQRIGIARALASDPDFIVCDEPLSALDVSIQAQMINLLRQLQQTLGLTYLFIAHDLAVVKYLCDRVAVMYLGELMEVAPSDKLYRSPQHPYTQALLSCIPNAGLQHIRSHSKIVVPGERSYPLTPPKGCPFALRCPHALGKCHQEKAPLKEVSPGHWTACHLSSAP